MREFTEEVPGGAVGVPAAYSRGELLKDVNYLNSIYNHVLVMISSHLSAPPHPNNYQLPRMSRQIESLILENVQLKGQIDAQYRSMIDLHQLADHLGKTPTELAQGQFNDFLADFEQKGIE